MGQLLMAATVFQTVATLVPQLSQLRSTLRHCASCLSPYGGKALTGAVLLRGLLAQKRSVANIDRVTPIAAGRRGAYGPRDFRKRGPRWFKNSRNGKLKFGDFVCEQRQKAKGPAPEVN
jgi:hypothetical protein